ncbi:helix-turn-helix domain-containing protein [Microbispora hainanensis]|uniref:helix-turn-helix domain-containing protein n=1 Tax=Microbispora hainanensis TaxID=568844 RepID=UPI003AF38855
MARCIVEDGWSIRRAAERFRVSHTTAARWAHRYRTNGAAVWTTGPAVRTAVLPAPTRGLSGGS